MEDYLYSLAPEIVNRKFIKRPFSESELLYLLYNLVKLATLLKEKGFSIGTINPENVVVSD